MQPWIWKIHWCRSDVMRLAPADVIVSPFLNLLAAYRPLVSDHISVSTHSLYCINYIRAHFGGQHVDKTAGSFERCLCVRPVRQESCIETRASFGRISCNKSTYPKDLEVSSSLACICSSHNLLNLLVPKTATVTPLLLLDAQEVKHPYVEIGSKQYRPHLLSQCLAAVCRSVALMYLPLLAAADAGNQLCSGSLAQTACRTVSSTCAGSLFSASTSS